MDEVQVEKEDGEDSQVDINNPFWSHDLKTPGGVLEMKSIKKPKLSHLKSKKFVL